VHLAVLVHLVGTLPVVHAKGQHSKIATALQPIVHEHLLQFPHSGRRPVQKRPNIALILDGAVDRVGPVQGNPLRTALHVLITKGHLALAQAQAQFIARVQAQVHETVPQLGHIA